MWVKRAKKLLPYLDIEDSAEEFLKENSWWYFWESVLIVLNMSETVNKGIKIDDDFLKPLDFEVEIKLDSELDKEDIS